MVSPPTTTGPQPGYVELSLFQEAIGSAQQAISTLSQELDQVRARLAWEQTEGRRRHLGGYVFWLPDLPTARERVEKLTSLLVPHGVAGLEKVRLGRPYDGGYVCLNDFDVDTVFSLGISDDVSWDVDVLTRGDFLIHQYDPTVEAPGHSDRFRFHKQPISGDAQSGVTLTKMLRDAGISKPASAILKIDIEGAEYPAILSTPDEDLNCFSQIIGEFHYFEHVLDDGWYERALHAFTKLSKQFRLVHVHGNNCAGQMVLGSKLFPACLEMTLANIERYSLSPSNETFPTPLDMPCSLTKPEIVLDHFKF